MNPHFVLYRLRVIPRQSIHAIINTNTGVVTDFHKNTNMENNNKFHSSLFYTGYRDNA